MPFLCVSRAEPKCSARTAAPSRALPLNILKLPVWSHTRNLASGFGARLGRRLRSPWTLRCAARCGVSLAIGSVPHARRRSAFVIKDKVQAPWKLKLSHALAAPRAGTGVQTSKSAKHDFSVSVVKLSLFSGARPRTRDPRTLGASAQSQIYRLFAVVFNARVSR